MNVCMLVTSFYPDIGGIQFQSLRLSRELIKNGIKVYVLTRNSSKEKPYEDLEGIKIYRFPVFGKNCYLNSLLYSFFSLFWLIRNKRLYDVIHCHQVYSPATIASIAKLMMGKKIVVKVTATNEYGEVKEIKRLPFYHIRKNLLKNIDKFISITAQVSRELSSIGIPESKMINIPNGVEVGQESAFNQETRNKYKKALKIEYDKIVLFSGRLAQEKGLEILLKAWPEIIRQFPACHLIILGDGGPVRNIEKKIKDLASNLKDNRNIHFKGWVNNVRDYLLASDIYCLPSISEGMSNSLLEAMAAGMAIAASDIDANRALIEDNYSGVLFRCGDYGDLSKKIIYMLQNDSLMKQISVNAKDFVSSNCAFPVIVKKTLALYAELDN